MSSSVIVRSDEELCAHRSKLLEEAGMSYEELKECAEEWALSERQMSLWSTIQGIDFLLDDE